MKNMKILLIAGHGAGDPGACSNYGTEANETRRVVNRVKELFNGYETEVDIYPINRNAYDDIANGTLQVNFANYDYVFEVHFNSSGNESATGVEIYVTYAESGVSVERKVVGNISSLGFPNRGVKREDFRVIRTAKNKGVSAALLETCFISNQGDMARYNSNFNQVCNSIVNGIAEEFGLTRKSGYIETVVDVANVKTNVVAEKPKVSYFVKTSSGKQLGAFNVLENAKNMASKNKAAVYDINGTLIYSYIETSKKYLNLNPHVQAWRVYPLDKAPVVGNECAKLSPSQYGGLSYEILEDRGNIKLIQTAMFGKVQIYAPVDNDSSITNNPIY